MAESAGHIPSASYSVQSPLLDPSKKSSNVAVDMAPKPENVDPENEELAELEALLSKTGKTVTWQNIEASVPVAKSKERKQVLRKVSGVALPGEILAIMGGSGAGKTTLMNILAHLDQTGVQKTGDVRINGKRLDKSEVRKFSCYVQQVDLFCGTLTVREQLIYSALLRMDNKFTMEQKMEKVNQVMREMNLIDCQNTVIGIPNRVKGISIGEKKRLAFASEILTEPAILFCDEPTSGLDSFMASQVVAALKLMAERGKTIVTVIHQPSSAVFNMFHKVLFMANGKPAYHGPVKEICNFFNSLGPEYRVPESYNVADYAIAQLSVTPEKKEEDNERIETIRKAYENTKMGKEVLTLSQFKTSQEDADLEKAKKRKYPASFGTQFWVLFRRAFFTTLRDPLLLKVKLVQVIITAAAIAIVNWQTPLTGPSIQNLEGVLYNTCRDMNFLFVFPSVNVITSELPIVYRENRARIYSIESYYFSKSLAELPQYIILPLIYATIIYWTTGLYANFANFAVYAFVSICLVINAVSIGYAGACVFGTEGTAVTYLPMLSMPMLVFGGFYVQVQNIPIYFKYIAEISWFRHGFQALMINQWKEITEINGCANLTSHRNDTAGYCPAEDGDGVLKHRGMNGDFWMSMIWLSTTLIIFRLLGYAALATRARFGK